MLEGTEVRTGIDFFEFRKENPEIAEKIIFTGMIDEYFGYQLGALEYRSVRFETEVLDVRTIREMLLSITQSVKFRIQELSSISILSLASRRRPLFPESIHQNGVLAWSHIIR